MTKDITVALVSGANRGIGMEIARQLGLSGAHVVVGSRMLKAGLEAAEVFSAEGISAEAVVLDVVQQRTISALRRHLVQTHGGLDILVNNAGVSLQGFDADIVRETLAVNYFGAVDLTDELLPVMRSGARIVNISSSVANRDELHESFQSAFGDTSLSREGLEELLDKFSAAVKAGNHRHLGWPSSAYRISKLALNELTQILHRELESGPRGIVVNSACPGWVKTRMGGPGAINSLEEGADTAVWLATDEKVGGGGFYSKRHSIDW